MKVKGHGQATPMNQISYRRIRKHLLRPAHQLLLDIAYYTGERWGAILQLQVEDVYQNVRRRIPRQSIIYRAATRKDNSTREVPVHHLLESFLKAYDPPESGWLFPSPIDNRHHLSTRAADNFFRRALERAGLDNQGYSPYSTRRGFITQLNNNGTAIRTIQKLTGHKSLTVLSRYIEVSEQQLVNAIALL
ncbi:MAG TPA: site-specific integrase [Coleofasciculaceae cyanobacterium]